MYVYGATGPELQAPAVRCSPTPRPRSAALSRPRRPRAIATPGHPPHLSLIPVAASAGTQLLTHPLYSSWRTQLRERARPVVGEHRIERHDEDQFPWVMVAVLFPAFYTSNIPFPLERISAFLHSKRIRRIYFLCKVFLQNSCEKPLIQTGPVFITNTH